MQPELGVQVQDVCQVVRRDLISASLICIKGDVIMAKVVRSISKDASVVATAIDATDIVAEIERIHQPSAVVTAALGRLSIAASLIGLG